MEYLNITATKETVDLFFPKAFQKCLTDVIKKQTGNYYITDAFRDDPLLCCSGSLLYDLENSTVLTCFETHRFLAKELDNKHFIIFCQLINKENRLQIFSQQLPLDEFFSCDNKENMCDVIFIDMPFQMQYDIVYNIIPKEVCDLVVSLQENK